MLIFRQLFDLQSATYSYLLADVATREAVIIDPVFEKMRRDAALLTELSLRLVGTLETHVHADHVTGAALLRQRLGSKIAVAATSGVQEADLYLSAGDIVKFGNRYLSVRATPGHTQGCLTYVLDNESMAFTGDCILIREADVPISKTVVQKQCTARSTPKSSRYRKPAFYIRRMIIVV